MGYCAVQLESQFEMKVEDLPKALSAILALRLSWMNHDFYKINNFDDMMARWDWEVQRDDSGNVDEIEFWGEKLGDDEELFKAIAPFVKEGSFIEMSGEEGHRWRWSFDGTTCVSQEGKTTYE